MCNGSPSFLTAAVGQTQSRWELRFEELIMKTKKLFCTLFSALFLTSSSSFALADEGMWPFNNVPKAQIKQKYAFDVTDAWLNKVQLASVRFNSGGSGSFVSADGLVLTNHHIASDVLQKISTPEKDYVKEGFYARTRDREVKAPDLELNQLVSIEDVTDRVTSAVKPGMSPAEVNAARRAATALRPLICTWRALHARD